MVQKERAAEKEISIHIIGVVLSAVSFSRNDSMNVNTHISHECVDSCCLKLQTLCFACTRTTCRNVCRISAVQYSILLSSTTQMSTALTLPFIHDDFVCSSFEITVAKFEHMCHFFTHCQIIIYRVYANGKVQWEKKSKGSQQQQQKLQNANVFISSGGAWPANDYLLPLV